MSEKYEEHVHVYKVVEKWEVDTTSKGSEALAEALEAVKKSGLKGEKPETEYLAIIPEKP